MVFGIYIGLSFIDLTGIGCRIRSQITGVIASVQRGLGLIFRLKVLRGFDSQTEFCLSRLVCHKTLGTRIQKIQRALRAKLAPGVFRANHQSVTLIITFQ